MVVYPDKIYINIPFDGRKRIEGTMIAKWYYLNIGDKVRVCFKDRAYTYELDAKIVGYNKEIDFGEYKISCKNIIECDIEG